jgi:hypothetical protein
MLPYLPHHVLQFLRLVVLWWARGIGLQISIANASMPTQTATESPDLTPAVDHSASHACARATDNAVCPSTDCDKINI